MQYFLLIIGLAVIVKSADILIDSSSKIARKYGFSTFIIGITVVAFGTSAPELAVGIMSGIAKANTLTLGNVIGSAMANITLIVGISAIIMPLTVRNSVVRREIPMLIGVELALAAMMFLNGLLSRINGIILLVGFVGFMLYIIRDSKQSMRIQIDAQGDSDTGADANRLPGGVIETEGNEKLPRLWILSIISLAGLFIGGRLTVSASTNIASSLGLDETLIGLTVVALATTMPELITSIMAAVKKEPDIVLGNCIGSNFFNILLVLGLSSVITPIPTSMSLLPDLIIIVAITAAVFAIALIRKSIKRLYGIALLAIYLIYLVYRVAFALR